jgi:dipeptidyl aminopeptidase/acylaminoacyl peptidase
MNRSLFRIRLSSLLAVVVAAAACGDDDAIDDDGGGSEVDAGAGSEADSGAGTPDGGGVPPDGGGDPDAGIEPDAAPVGPGHIWVHGDLLTDGRVQLFAYEMGSPIPGTPAVTLPAGETATLFPTVNSGAYDITRSGQRVALPADIEVPGRYDLYMARTDGTQLTRVVAVSDDADVEKARISPDGTRIAFTADLETDGVFGAYVVPSNTADATPVLVSPAGATADVDDIVWSSDSSSIVFTGPFTDTGVFELLIADVTVANPTPVPLVTRADIQATSTPSGVIRPIQSRDGSVLFRGRLAADNAIRLYVVNSNGAGAPSVLPLSEIPRTDGTTIADVGPIGLSPNGNLLAFGADQTLRVEDLWVVPVNVSAAPTRLTAGLVPPASGTINIDIAQPLKWSRDGQQVAFVADYITLGKHEPFVAPIDGSGHRRLANVAPGDGNGDAVAVDFSPDGTQVFMVADHLVGNQVELFVLDAALTDQEPVLVLGATTGGDLRGDITVTN